MLHTSILTGALTASILTLAAAGGVAAQGLAMEPVTTTTTVVTTRTVMPVPIVAQNVEVMQSEAEPGKAIVTMDLYNAGGNDALVSVSSPLATKSEMNVYNGAVVQKSATIPLWTDHTINMQATRTHVKLLGISEALTEGQTIPLTLHFKNGIDLSLQGTVTATLNDPFIERHVNYTIYQVVP